jgi:hypothetical protein
MGSCKNLGGGCKNLGKEEREGGAAAKWDGRGGRLQTKGGGGGRLGLGGGDSGLPSNGSRSMAQTRSHIRSRPQRKSQEKFYCFTEIMPPKTPSPNSTEHGREKKEK